MERDQVHTYATKARDVIALAVWFGVVTGLIEGSLLLALEKFHWLPWSMDKWPVSLEIVWIATFFDLLLFLATGLAFVGLSRRFPRVDLLRWYLFFISLLACFDWLALAGRLRTSAALILAAGVASVVMRWYSQRESTSLQFVHRTLPWVAAAALVVIVGTNGGFWLKERIATAHLRANPPGSPNILVIVVDTLRADHLSAYGYKRPTSPNLDRFANQGVLFENAFSASSWTVPSHASLLTGRYLHEHGAGTAQNHNYYDGPYPSIAQVLRVRGFRTGAFSANTVLFCRARGFGTGFLHFEDFYRSWADMASRTLYGRKLDQFVLYPLGYRGFPGPKRAAEVNDEFLRWVDRAPGKPFFAFLNYFDVHDPYLPPEPYRSRFIGSGGALPGGLIDQSTSQPRPNQLTSEQLQGERDAYDGAIAYVDEQIAQLFTALAARGLAEKTIVVITSDHGEEIGEHGLLIHGNSLYRQEIHVPLIVRWPGHVPAGVRLGTPVSNAALPPTLMDLAGLGEKNMFPEPSLAQLWSSSENVMDWPEPLSELAPNDPFSAGGMRTLISRNWQYIKHDDSSEELYDWKNDPEETRNLAGTPEGQTIDRDFRARLNHLVGYSFGKQEGGKQIATGEPKVVGLRSSSPSPQLH